MKKFAPDNSGKIQISSNEASVNWLLCDAPSDDDKKYLVGLGVDLGLLNDALDPHEVPRLEFTSDWIYLIMRAPNVSGDSGDFTTPILFAINANMLITVSRDDLSQLWQPFIEGAILDSGQTKQLFLMMMDFMAQNYQSKVAQINRQMRALTDNTPRTYSKEIISVVEHERRLNDYLDALIPTNTALERLLSKDDFKFREEDADEIEDLSIDFEQVIARCKSLLRTIQNDRDSYRTIMDTRLNETMRALTVITVTLTIPTMLAGLLGMNVKLPFDIHSELTFWGIVGMSIIASLAVSLYFKKR